MCETVTESMTQDRVKEIEARFSKMTAGFLFLFDRSIIVEVSPYDEIGVRWVAELAADSTDEMLDFFCKSRHMMHDLLTLSTKNIEELVLDASNKNSIEKRLSVYKSIVSKMPEGPFEIYEAGIIRQLPTDPDDEDTSLWVLEIAADTTDDEMEFFCHCITDIRFLIAHIENRM